MNCRFTVRWNDYKFKILSTCVFLSSFVSIVSDSAKVSALKLGLALERSLAHESEHPLARWLVGMLVHELVLPSPVLASECLLAGS